LQKKKRRDNICNGKRLGAPLTQAFAI
jgi:hypothetical protein